MPVFAFDDTHPQILFIWAANQGLWYQIPEISSFAMSLCSSFNKHVQHLLWAGNWLSCFYYRLWVIPRWLRHPQCRQGFYVLVEAVRWAQAATVGGGLRHVIEEVQSSVSSRKEQIASTLEGTKTVACWELDRSCPFKNSGIWTGRGEQCSFLWSTRCEPWQGSPGYILEIASCTYPVSSICVFMGKSLNQLELSFPVGLALSIPQNNCKDETTCIIIGKCVDHCMWLKNGR